MEARAPGNEEIEKLFEGLISCDRIPHAMLLAGEKGLGGIGLCRMFARSLMCENRGGGGNRVHCGQRTGKRQGRPGKTAG